MASTHDRWQRRNRAESLYWKALSRYNRRLDLYNATTAVILDDDGDTSPSMYRWALASRPVLRVLVKQARNLAANLEAAIWDMEGDK